ncbi:hypothetical protein Q7P37_008509 [Cladosporium fusiforme]
MRLQQGVRQADRQAGAEVGGEMAFLRASERRSEYGCSAGRVWVAERLWDVVESGRVAVEDDEDEGEGEARRVRRYKGGVCNVIIKGRRRSQVQARIFINIYSITNHPPATGGLALLSRTPRSQGRNKGTTRDEITWGPALGWIQQLFRRHDCPPAYEDRRAAARTATGLFRVRDYDDRIARTRQQASRPHSRSSPLWRRFIHPRELRPATSLARPSLEGAEKRGGRGDRPGSHHIPYQGARIPFPARAIKSSCST